MSGPNSNIIFLDISDEQAAPTPLSPNTWKVRLALNIKKLNYTTQWVSFIAIEPTLKSLGIGPTGTRPNGAPHYTLPALIDRTLDPDNPVLLADSTPIIEYLEKTYPSSSSLSINIGSSSSPLNAQGLLHYTEKSIIKELFEAPNMDLFIEAVYGLTKEGTPQREMFGMMLKMRTGKHPDEGIEKQGQEREEAWGKVEKALGVVGEAYDKAGATGKGGNSLFIYPNADGGPSVVDLRLASWVIWLRFLRGKEGWDERASKWHGGRWARFFEWFEEYLVVDGRRIVLP